MASDRMAKIISEIDSLSTKTGQLSTTVSRHLEEIESRLCKLTGKIEVWHTDNRGDLLGFTRIRGGDWVLQYYDVAADERYTATHANIEIKAKAAILLPALLNKMRNEQSRHIALLKNAVVSLETGAITVDDMSKEDE